MNSTSTSYKLFYNKEKCYYIIENGNSGSSMFSTSRLVSWLKTQNKIPPLYIDYNRATIRCYTPVLEFKELEELKNYFMEYLIWSQELKVPTFLIYFVYLK